MIRWILVLGGLALTLSSAVAEPSILDGDYVLEAGGEPGVGITCGAPGTAAWHYRDAPALPPAGMAVRLVSGWLPLSQLPAVGLTLVAAGLRQTLATADRPLAAAICSFVSEPPLLDGSRQPNGWECIPVLADFSCFGPKIGTPARRTRVRWCWDRENLYVLFECDDPDIWSTITRRDGPLWEGEVVELYVDHDGDGKAYREIEVNPLNTVVDLTIADHRQLGGDRLADYLRWDAAGMKTAVTVRGTIDKRDDSDSGWTVGMSVPLATLSSAAAMPIAGDTWRVQLYRIERPTQGELEFSAWSPTRTFHLPERFGFLTFSGPLGKEDFSAYPEGSAPSSPWSVRAGEWTVADGAVVGRDCPGDYVAQGLLRQLPTVGDAVVSLRFRVEERGDDWRDGPWIGVRASEHGMYSVNLTSRGIQVHKAWIGGTTGDANPLAEVPCTVDNQWHELHLNLQGNRIRVSVDGRILVDAVDRDHAGQPALTTGGICLAARKWSGAHGHTVVAFDDIRVTP